MHPIWVFYACRNVLERGPTPAQLQPGRISSEQMWELDVRVAATWVRDAGRVLWGVESGELQPWEAALREKTELWPRGDGLTRERWVFWGERLRWLGAGMGETRVVDEAATVVDGILELNLV